jgi:hypothetical protein
LVAASLALIAGIGIVATAVGVATMLPGGPTQDDSSGVPALAVNAPNSAAEPASNPNSIREIPMPSGASETAWRSEVAPPIPRPRPDEMLGRVESEPAATEEPPLAAAQPADASRPLPASSERAGPPSPAPAPVAPSAVAGTPATGGPDGLISSIEETLARIDANASAEAGPALPPAGQPLQVQPQATPPPLVMTQPIYPPPADIIPPPVPDSIEPAYDVAPPPANVDGYHDYSIGPVPPAPVPDVYPQAPYLNPAAPGVYPSESYSFPSETVKDTEVRQPGFLRRTLAKATDAVGRILPWN